MKFKKFCTDKPARLFLSVLLIFCVVFTIVYVIVDFKSHKFGIKPFLLPFKGEQVFEPKNAIETKYEKDKIVITIDLKNFGNTKDNIKIEHIENGIKISGFEKSEKDGTIKETSFGKRIIIPGKIHSQQIKQVEKGNEYIITIPLN